MFLAAFYAFLTEQVGCPKGALFMNRGQITFLKLNASNLLQF